MCAAPAPLLPLPPALPKNTCTGCSVLPPYPSFLGSSHHLLSQAGWNRCIPACLCVCVCVPVLLLNVILRAWTPSVSCTSRFGLWLLQPVVHLRLHCGLGRGSVQPGLVTPPVARVSADEEVRRHRQLSFSDRNLPDYRKLISQHAVQQPRSGGVRLI